MVKSNVAVMVVQVDMSGASFMWLKPVLVEGYFNLRGSLVLATPCGYSVLTGLANDLLSSGSCFSYYEDLLIAHLGLSMVVV